MSHNDVGAPLVNARDGIFEHSDFTADAFGIFENGATPAWLTLRFDGGGEETLHHTFNVKHPDTWNWTVSLNQMLAGRELRFTATDEETRAYAVAGTYDLKVRVTDDDGGVYETVVVIVIV